MERLTILMSSLKTLKTQRFPERSSNSNSSNEMSLVCVLSKRRAFPQSAFFSFICALYSKSSKIMYEAMSFVMGCLA